MSYEVYLRELLRPLGVYRLEGGISGGALAAVGAALDGCDAELADLEREMFLTTAQGEGLEAIASLLVRRPVTRDPERMGAALAALLRVGGDSFTLAAINDNLTGCGLNAVATEGTGAGTVEIRFPEVPGIPDGFGEMRKIIEDILPCHLDVSYVFWYITWSAMEERFPTWGDIEVLGLSWGELEKLVRE